MNRNGEEQTTGSNPPPVNTRPSTYYPTYPSHPAGYPEPPMFPISHFNSFVQATPAANKPVLGPSPGATYRIQEPMPTNQYAPQNTVPQRPVANQQQQQQQQQYGSPASRSIARPAPAQGGEQWKWGQAQKPRK